MGLSSAVSRSHMRPFGGRSPPFLVATLCVGLCVLAVSYWRLGIQYNDLEEQLRRLIQKKDSLEANESFISKQLELREENYSEAKVSLQKKEQELIDLKKRLDDDAAKLKETQKGQDDLKHNLEKLKNDLQAKETSLQELREKNKELTDENNKLKSDYEELKTKFVSLSKNHKEQIQKEDSKLNIDANNIDRSQSTNVIHPPENLNNNLPKSSNNIPQHADTEDIKSKQSDNNNKQEMSPQEQIQKPKIDPVVALVKNPNNNNVGKDIVGIDQTFNDDKINVDGRSKKDSSIVKNYGDPDDNGIGGVNGKLEDKDTLLDSNNLDDNNL